MATLLQNKKARHDYEVREEFSAGIALRGFEVKALKAHRGSLAGAYIIIRGGEAFLVNMDIPAYQPNNTPDDYDPKRLRKLLLRKKELARLVGAEKQKGLTIVPISVYTKRALIKVNCAIVRGKKKHDKRETLKKRDAQRDIDRVLKGQYTR